MGKLHDILVFLHEWQEIKREKRSYCKSCETYKEQLAIVNFEKKQLLERILFVPIKEAPVIQEAPKPIIPKIVPWKIQRQMLEAEDRATAALIKQKQEEMEKMQAAEIPRGPSGGVAAPPAEQMGTAQHVSEISITELEKELGVENAQ